MNTAYVDGYVVPWFSHTDTFIRIESGGMEYYTPLFGSQITHQVESFHGNIYLLTAEVPDAPTEAAMIAHANTNLAPYGLHVYPGSCQQMQLQVYGAPTFFCSTQTLAAKSQ